MSSESNSAVAEQPGLSATPKKKVVRRSTTGGKKKKAGKKGGRAVKKSKKGKREGLSQQAKAFLVTLLKAGATSVRNALDREKAWSKAGVTGSTSNAMRETKLVDRVDHEDGSRAFYLTAEGQKQAKAAQKE